VIIALLLIFGAYEGRNVIDALAQRADARAVAAESALKLTLALQDSQAKQTAADEATLTQVQQQYAQLVQTLSAQNAALQESLTQRDKALASSQAAIKTLPLPVVAQKIQTLENLSGADITAQAQGLTLSTVAADKILGDLEATDVLRQDNADLITTIRDNDQEIAKASVVMAEQNTVITGLKAQVTDDAKVLTDTKAADAKVLDAEKAKSKKAAKKWFEVGAIVGGILGGLIGHGI
jgi:hypothetical protein